MTIENEYALEDLIGTLIGLKDAEEYARRERIATEERIARLIPTKDSGQKTITMAYSGWKITVKRGFNYKADIEEIEKFGNLCELEMPIKVIKTLHIPKYELFRKNYPIFFNRMSQFVTLTPKKIAVSLQEPKE